jgi:hypothetical protein
MEEEEAKKTVDPAVVLPASAKQRMGTFQGANAK